MATNATDTSHSPSPLPSGAGPRAAEPAEVRAERERSDREALGLVREALVGLPAAAVLRPIEPVAAFVSAALAFADAEEQRRGSGLPQLASVRRHAAAMRAAQLDYLFKAPPAAASPTLAGHTDMRLTHLETAAARLVADGLFAEAELPVAAGASVRDRCARGLALVRFFRERGVKTRIDLDKTARDAARLARWGEETAQQTAVTDLRDRAYTALRAALDGVSRAPISGVFAIDEALAA